MGVKDLWKLLESTGRPVTLESLEGLVLAVDVSLWLHQAVRGVRDREGQSVVGAHLVLLFSRICKLLFYNIKPVFVFDGGTPALKQQTLALRSQRRQSAARKSEKVEQKQMTKFLQAKILEQLTGEKSSVAVPRSAVQPDLFELPPLVEDAFNKERSPVFEPHDLSYQKEVASVDVNSTAFSSLPPEVQHEILQEKQQMEIRTYTDPSSLPSVANDFSNYQLSKLMRRSRLNQKLEDVRKVLKSSETVVVGLGQGSQVCDVETSRIMSSDSAHYILVRGVDLESSSQDEAESRSSMEVGAEERGRGGGEGEGSGVRTWRKVGREEEEEEEEDEGEERKVKEKEEEEEKEEEMGGGYFPLESSSEDEQREGRELESEATSLGKESVREPGETAEVSAEIRRGPPESLPSGGGVEEVDTVAGRGAQLGKERKEGEGRREEGEYIMAQNSAVGLREDHPAPVAIGDDVMSVSGSESSESGIEDDMEPGPQLSIMASGLAQVHTVEGHVHLRVPDLKTSPGSMEPRPGEQQATTGQLQSGDMEPGQPQVGDMESGKPQTTHPDVPSPAFPGDDDQLWASDLLELGPEEAQSQLREEVGELERERARQTRLATSVSSSVYREAQELLSLFGLPYIVSPMEAEAQCAYLDHTHQVDGTVTDDSDVFLFGGQKVFRSFFSQDKEVTTYHVEDIRQAMGLNRGHLVTLAYLLGSDYTVGLEGVGVVSAMEFIGHFRGDGMEPLKKFKEWHTAMNSAPGLTLTSSFEKKLRQVELPVGFPSQEVWSAYHCPEVDESREELQWGRPDLDLIRKYMTEHVGWPQSKVDETLLPVLKKMSAKESQRRITSFFPSGAPPPKAIKSSRLRNAVSRLTNTGHTGESSQLQSGQEAIAVTRVSPPRKRRKRKDERPAEEGGEKGEEGSSSDEEFTSGSTGRGRGKRRRRGRGEGKGGVTQRRGRGEGMRGRGRGRGKGKGRREATPPAREGPKLSASSSSSDSDEFDRVVRGLKEEELSHLTVT